MTLEAIRNDSYTPYEPQTLYEAAGGTLFSCELVRFLKAVTAGASEDEITRLIVANIDAIYDLSNIPIVSRPRLKVLKGGASR